MEVGLAAQGLPAWRGGVFRMVLPTRRGGSAWCLANPRRRCSARSAAWRIRAAGAVHGLLLGGFTLPAKLQGALAFCSAPISGARSLSFATQVPRLPIFWVLLQKMGPKFDIIPELLGGFRGTISRRLFPTWGNACARRHLSPFLPAKPPRSLDGPIAAA